MGEVQKNTMESQNCSKWEGLRRAEYSNCTVGRGKDPSSGNKPERKSKELCSSNFSLLLQTYKSLKEFDISQEKQRL